MILQLIKDEFSSNDAMELITQMITIKIKYHENKISISNNEEDHKRREVQIIHLQKELFELRNKIKTKKEKIKIDFVINIE